MITVLLTLSLIYLLLGCVTYLVAMWGDMPKWSNVVSEAERVISILIAWPYVWWLVWKMRNDQ